MDKSKFNSYKSEISEPELSADAVNLMKNIQAVAPTGFAINDSFLETNAQYYNAAAYSADFKNPTVVNDINNWVKANTMDMIDMLLEEIPDSMLMCLINAVAFDAVWEEKFATDFIKKENFTCIDGSIKSVDMMHQNSKIKYIEPKNAIGIIKDYSGGNYSFVALLPDEKIDIYDYIDSLDGKAFIDAVNSAKDKDIALSLPKFSYEF